MKTVFQKIFAALTALFLTLAASGQDSDVLTLHGHVLDSSTSESLFFASVSLSGSRISNA